MKLFLLFANTRLGVLEKAVDGYVYNSIIENERRLMEVRTLTKSEYELCNSDRRKSDRLFPEFIRIVRFFTRKDILESAGIDSQDSDWIKLVKISKLRIYPGSVFYVQQAGQDQ